MPRKIVIIPTFASSHLLKCWIPNVIEAINPDIIIINEGLFPQGPENKGHIGEEFKKKWCSGVCGFDWDDTVEIVQDKYRSFWGGLIKQPTSIRLHPIEYEKGLSANECFLKAMTFTTTDNPTNFDLSYGDLVFSIEPDAFHLESDADKITQAVSSLKPGEGLQTNWIDFLGTQHYTEAINVSQPKWRRFCYCFDNMENYKSAIDGFMSQSYPKLRKVDDFITYHYPWFVYDKWKELRYELIYRSDPNYWKEFEKGLQEIRNVSQVFIDLKNTEGSHCSDDAYLLVSNMIKGKIVIRPSRSDEGRYAQFIDVPHPIAIHSHPNFVK